MKWGALACLLVACLTCKPADSSAVLPKVESLRAAGDLRGALELVDRSLRDSLPTVELHARLAIARSQILREQQGTDHALAYLHSLPQPKEPFSAYLIRREEALAEADLGQFTDADRHIRDAIAFADQARKPSYAAGMKLVRSRVLLRLNREEEARQCVDEAKSYAQTTGDHSLDAFILKFTARLDLETNQFEAAIAPLKASYDRFRAEKRPERAAEVTIDLAWAYYRLGHLEKARRLYEECERGVPARDKHICVGHKGNIFYDMGDLKQAAAAYRQAADLAKNLSQDYYSNWLVNLATTLTDEGYWAEAASVNSGALEIVRNIKGSRAVNHALVNAARIAAGQNRFEEAETTLLAVESQPHADPAAVLDAYAALAHVYAARGNPKLAKQQFQAALTLADRAGTKLQDEEDKLSYLASLMKLHQQYVAFLMARDDVAGAFQASENSRARVLRSRLQAKDIAVAQHGIPEYQRVSRSLNSTLLVYWTALGKSYCWVVGPTTFEAILLPDESKIRTLVERHQGTVESVSGYNRSAAQSNSAALFDAVVRPVLAAAPGSKRFIVVPDGPLYGINFETLRQGSRFWIQDATITVAPSLELLLGKTSATHSNGKAMVVGDAVPWEPGFPALLNAGKELQEVASEFPSGEVTTLSGPAANAAAFLNTNPAKYSYIHFAAHAVPDRDSPLDSAIILSAGRLSVRDVLQTRIKALLVTISACSSAGARTYSGEGLVGLAWAFLRAGAHNVVAGLWEVNDYSSPVLMKAMYGGLVGGASPEDALRSAKLQLIKDGKYADPYYWGAFQLYLGPR